MDVHASGELRSPHTAMLVAPSLSGALQIVHLLKTGTAVKTGDVVIEFDPSEQEFNLEQSRSQLEEASQQIAKAQADAAVKAAQDKVDLLKAKFDVRRAELDVQRNELLSEIDAKKNLLNLEEAKRRLEQLQQDISSRAASNTAAIALLEEKRRTSLLGMQQAQQNIDNMKVKSSMDGLVSLKDNQDASGGFGFQGMSLPEYREGDVVFPGRFIAEILDLAQMEVVAKISENDRANVTPGQAAEIRSDAQPDHLLEAKVKTVAGTTSRGGDFGASSVRHFDVTFALLHQESGMRPGTSADITVRGSEMRDQLFLPSQCLFEKDGKLVVFVKQGNHFQSMEAKIKVRTENRIAIENLAEGTEVALVDPEMTAEQKQKASSTSPLGVSQ